MIKKNKIPTIIGVVILLAATFAGVFFLRMNQIFRIGANASDTPKDVRVGNLSDSSATISWTTGAQTAGFITWGNSAGSINKIENESQVDQRFFTHSVTLSGLKPITGYFYKINSGGTDFDNNGVPWQFTTGEQIAASTTSLPISGSVISASGQPSKRALVYIDIDGYLLSTLTSDAGNFVLQLGGVRTSDLKSAASIDPAQTLLTVSVQAESGETASAQIFPQSANPIPPLVLGQVQDFRNLQPTKTGQNPNADLNLPANTSTESKFNVATSSGTPAPTSVVLESLTEGEVVTSTDPQFFGKGPAGEKITITVQSSQEVSQTVQIPKTGSWSWTPPTPLSEGTHSIVISWIDATGITRTLTRNFVVQASGAPAFVASPSATPTSTPRVTATSTPVATLAPITTPTAIATAEPVPITGSLTPTILLSIMGIAVIAFSFAIWKYAAN